MTQEIGLFLTLGPKSDCIRQSIHRLQMATNEGPAKVYMFYLVLLRLQICNLSNVVTENRQLYKNIQRSREVL